MTVLEVKNVSIRYMTGDFKDIGLKEFGLEWFYLYEKRLDHRIAAT